MGDLLRRYIYISVLVLVLLVALSPQALAGMSFSLKSGMGAGLVGIEATSPSPAFPDNADVVMLIGFAEEVTSLSLGARLYLSPDGFRPYLYLAAGVAFVDDYYETPVLCLGALGAEYLSPGGLRLAVEGGLGLLAASGEMAATLGVGFSIGYRFP